MAGVFGVSNSACYKRVKKGVSVGRKEGDEELVELIRRIQEQQHHYR
jgi:hypothetical protein